MRGPRGIVPAPMVRILIVNGPVTRPVQIGKRIMARLVSWFGWLGRRSLLLRFSLLSFAVLALIAYGLATVLEGEMEQDALHQQADEVAVVVQGVIGRHMWYATVMDAVKPSERQWWAGLAHQLML